MPMLHMSTKDGYVALINTHTHTHTYTSRFYYHSFVSGQSVGWLGFNRANSSDSRIIT